MGDGFVAAAEFRGAMLADYPFLDLCFLRGRGG